MNLRTALRLRPFALCVFYFLLSNFYFRPQATGAPAADLHAFFGQVTAVNLAAKTITIQLGKSFVFHVTAETQISSAAGGAVPFEKIRIGDGALVTMRTGPGNIGIAVKILLVSGATFPADYSARTTKGEHISGAALSSYVVYKPPREDINRGINFGIYRSGLFLLSVAPDGTVPNVKVLRTLGYEELDVRTVKWLKKWRFRPNSLTEVRMPISYHRTR
jgi:TonB family protein